MSAVEMNTLIVRRSSGLMSLLLIILMILAGPAAQASCLVENEELINLGVSPETRTWGDYSGAHLISASRVYKCQEDAGRYLMLTLGASQWSDSSAVRNTYIFDNYEPMSCKIENSQVFSDYHSQRTKENFSREYKFIRSCFDLRVADMGNAPIIAKEKQEYCTVERISDSVVVLRGDMCFLKIKPQNQFSVQPIFNDKCADPDYLQKIGIQAQDMYANLNILTTRDDSGYSQDLTSVASRPLHINIAPNSRLLNLTEDFGTGVPRFSTTYNINADWGSLDIKSDFKKQTEINLSFFVSNMTDKKCVGTDCVSSSNFTQPFMGQVEIYKLENGRPPKLVEEWWDGGLVPPNWQGYVNGIRYRVPDQVFESGKRYRMVATFQDPTDDYAIFLSGLKQMLIRSFEVEGATVGVDSIPALSTLDVLGVLPQFSGLPQLGRQNQTVNIGETIKGLEGIISSTIWPPYYDSICDNDKCSKLGKRKFQQRLVLEFVIDQPEYDGDSAIIRDIQMEKVSPVFKSYPMQKANFINMNCGG